MILNNFNMSEGCRIYGIFSTSFRASVCAGGVFMLCSVCSAGDSAHHKGTRKHRYSLRPWRSSTRRDCALDGQGELRYILVREKFVCGAVPAQFVI